GGAPDLYLHDAAGDHGCARNPTRLDHLRSRENRGAARGVEDILYTAPDQRIIIGAVAIDPFQAAARDDSQLGEAARAADQTCAAIGRGVAGRAAPEHVGDAAACDFKFLGDAAVRHVQRAVARDGPRGRDARVEHVDDATIPGAQAACDLEGPDLENTAPVDR